MDEIMFIMLRVGTVTLKLVLYSRNTNTSAIQRQADSVVQIRTHLLTSGSGSSTRGDNLLKSFVIILS